MATAMQIKNYFGMDTRTFTTEWRALSDEEKEYFRAELDKVLAEDPTAGGDVPNV